MPARDAKRKRNLRTSFWVALSLILLGLAFIADDAAGRLLILGASPFWRTVAVVASKAGEGWVIAVVGTLVSLLLWRGGRLQGGRLVLLVTVTGLLTGATATVLRTLIGRTRPDSHELQGFYGIWHNSHCIIGQYEFSAFPSGHVATVMGVAAATWLINRRLGMLAAAYALLVSWSRIALGCHHFSDTVAAAILAIFGAQLVRARLPLAAPIQQARRFLQALWLHRKRASETRETHSQA